MNKNPLIVKILKLIRENSTKNIKTLSEINFDDALGANLGYSGLLCGFAIDYFQLCENLEEKFNIKFDDYEFLEKNIKVKDIIEHVLTKTLIKLDIQHESLILRKHYIEELINNYHYKINNNIYDSTIYKIIKIIKETSSNHGNYRKIQSFTEISLEYNLGYDTVGLRGPTPGFYKMRDALEENFNIILCEDDFPAYDIKIKDVIDSVLKRIYLTLENRIDDIMNQKENIEILKKNLNSRKGKV